MSRKITAFTAMTAGTQLDSYVLAIVNPAAGSVPNGNLKATLTALFATATASGLVSTTTQSLAGAKTFTTSATSPLVTGTTSVTAGVISTTTGSLILANAGSAFTLTQQAPALAAARTYIWPTADPTAGQAIVGTLAGATITLSYATVPTGSGIAAQVAFWTSTSAIGGDVGFTFDSGTDTLTLGLAATSTGTLTLANAGGATTTSIQAGNAAATRVLRLPTVDPTAGQALVAAAPSGSDILLSYATVPTGSGATSQVAIWSSASALSGSAFFTAPLATGLVSITGAVGDGTNNQASLLITKPASVGVGLSIVMDSPSTGKAFRVIDQNSNAVTYIGDDGGYFTVISVVISGTFTGTGNDIAVTAPGTSVGEPSMLGVWSDVNGPGSIYRLANSIDPLNRFATYLDFAGNYILDINAAGKLSWGAGVFAALDMTLGRVSAGVMDITGAATYLDNNQAYGFKTTGGVRTAILQLDNGNSTFLYGTGANTLKLVAGAGGLVRITDNAQSVAFLDIADTAGSVLINTKTNANIELAPLSGTAVVTVTGTGILRLGTVSSLTGTLTLANSGGAFTTSIQGAAVAASRTYILPTTDPSAGQALVGTLAGSTITLSFATVSTGSGTANAIPYWATTTTFADSQFIRVSSSQTDLRSGVTAQNLDVFITYTSAANNERLTINGKGDNPFVQFGFGMLAGTSGGTAQDVWIFGGSYPNGQSNKAGANLALVGGAGTGSGAGGQILFGLAPAGSPGTVTNVHNQYASLQTDALHLGSSTVTTGALKFENASNSNITTFTITTPTAARTITFPDATGTVALTVENISVQTSSPVAVTTADTGKTFTNTGAAGTVEFDLPAATGSGVWFRFVRDANQSVVLDPNGTEIIYAGASVTTAGGSVTLDSVGTTITIVDAASGEWYAMAITGSVTTA